MAIATARTTKFGGAASTFATVASPGAALTTLFNAIDTALIAAGWTNIFTGTNTNSYSSPGESGNEKLFLVMATGAMGVVSGVDVSGGSYLWAGVCQYADGSGNYYNSFGYPHLSTPDGVANTVLELEPSLTWDYAIVADKDGLAVAAVPTTSHADGPYFLNTGVLKRPAGVNANILVTSATISSGAGSNVTVNVTTDPIAAGYLPGDIVAVIAQNGISGHLADTFSTRLISLTSSSVTLELVPTLGATIATGALIGEDPQPFFGMCRTQGVVAQQPFPTNNGLAKCSPFPGISMNTAANMWTTHQSSAAGNIIANNNVSFFPGSFAQGGQGADASVRPDARTGAYFIDTFFIRDNSSGASSFGVRGKVSGRMFCSAVLNASLPASLTFAFAKRHNVSGEEWVGFGDTAGASKMGIEAWMGPFPVVNATTKVVITANSDLVSGCTSEIVLLEQNISSDGYESTTIGQTGAWSMDSSTEMQTAAMQLIPLDQGGSTSSDDVQPVLIDQPYPLDYTYMPTNQESPNFNRGFN